MRENIKPKIIDAFLFYNEIGLLKTRLQYLGEAVDYFIISEANIDFAGEKKVFLLNDDQIKTLPYGEKIIYHREYINLSSMGWLYKKLKYRNRKKSYLWKIQDTQRNAILKSLRQFSPNDFLIFGDLDEIPNIDTINEGVKKLQNFEASITQPSIFCFNQKFFYYNINHCATNGSYHGTAITTIKTAQQIKPHKIRSEKDKLPLIENGGWHFSYFLSEEDIAKKINAICEVENLEAFKGITTEEIIEKLRLGTDLFGRDIPLNEDGKNTISPKLLNLLNLYLPHCT